MMQPVSLFQGTSRMPQDNLQLLRDAIGRGAGLVVSLPTASGLLRHHKSRFLGEDPDGFWIESMPTERELIDEIAATGRHAGLSFKAGFTKAVFAAPVLRREPQYRLNARSIVEAVLIQQPRDVNVIQ